MWRFCLARIRLNPLSGKILHHDSVPVMVSRFTSLIEDFVQCVFCKKPLLFWFSSRHRNVGLSESEYKYCASFIVLPLLLTSSPSLLVACSSLRFNTEPEDELEAALFPDAWSASGLNDSCGCDVGETDNPGTTRGTKLSVLQIIVFPSLVNRGSRPQTHSQEYPWSLQSLPSNRTAGVSSKSCTVTNWFKSWTPNTCASKFVCTSPSAVCTTVGFPGPRQSV